MRYLLTTLVILVGIYSTAQTWSDDVAQIVYDKCSKCHNSNGVAPFPLTTYAETSPMAVAMYDAINQDEMPPWPPNNDYQQYVHDRSLSASEKQTMLDWLQNGTPEGNPANTPPPPVFSSAAQLGAGDLEVSMPVYMSKALSNGDDYACFAVPSGLTEDRVIKAIEIIPGNREIVHHALIYIDPTGNSFTDSLNGDCGGPNSVGSKLVMGYTPGSSPMTLPSVSPLKLGMSMQANSQVFFAMHYPEGSYGEFDSTKVIFHFYPPGETGIREVETDPILQNWSFTIPPNQIVPVNASYNIPSDYSLLSVFPHMHLLGHDMKVFGLQPNQDTLKLIDLPHWDFEWQDFYFFKNIQVIQGGGQLRAEGNFDNTTGNLHNPNTPPITVYPGLNTSDEMFLTYFHYLPYQAGDELYDMDSLLNASTASIIEEQNPEFVFNVYPNPFNDGVNLYTKVLNPGDQISVFVYNNQGKLITKLAENELSQAKELKLSWDGNDSNGANVASGLYMISVNVNGKMSNHRVVKR